MDPLYNAGHDHATDSEEAIEFTGMEKINCMVEKYPLVKANGDYGNFPRP
jgi:hypothetical protein